MANSSKAWDDAYKAYKKTEHYSIHRLSREKWEKFVLGEEKPRRKRKTRQPQVVPQRPAKSTRSSRRNGPVRDVLDKEAWLETNREYLRWRKTADFAKWRHKQFLKQGGTCYYCDQPIFGGVRQNVDHVIPKIRRGDNRKSNLVLACSDCNKKKYSDMLPYKERQILKQKNSQKRGTYQQTKQLFSEDSIIDMLRNF